MLERIIQEHEPLSNFLAAFGEAFKNSPQYLHLQAYVIDLLIYLGSRNLTGLSLASDYTEWSKCLQRVPFRGRNGLGRGTGGARGYTVHVRSHREESQEKRRISVYRARRWIVERTHPWLNRF